MSGCRGEAGKNIEIQFIRLLSIGLVILCHIQAVMFPKDVLNYVRIFSYVDPEIGVDVFFVISGYLMGQSFLSRSLDRDYTKVVPAVFGFWKRRFRRLFPASFFWITFTVAVALCSQQPGVWPGSVEMVRLWSASVLALENFANTAAPSSLGYYWSLSAENQFYFALPLVWFALPRKFFWWFVCGLIALSVVYRPGGENWKFLRFDGLLWGLALYRLLKSDVIQSWLNDLHPPPGWAKWSMLVVSLLAMSGVLVAVGPAFTPLAYAVDCLLASIMVGLATLDRGFIPLPPTAWGRALADRGGDLAYSLYLCHLPLWFVVRDVAKRLGFNAVSWHVMVPIGLATAVSAAMVSHHFLEVPFYRRRPLSTAALLPRPSSA